MRLSRPLISSVALGLALTAGGCTILDPYTGEEKMSNAAKGGLIGAGIGAVAGIISGDDSRERRKRAMIGAGIGALAGGSVGYYMDRQEARLREQLAGSGVQVVRQGDHVVLNMPGNVTFDTESAALKSGFYDVLNSVALVLNEYEQTYIEVAGHTDSRGTDAFNNTLSQQRADSVASYLSTREVLRDRIDAFGLGERHPIADNETDGGRQTNRRVELTLVPLT